MHIGFLMVRYGPERHSPIVPELIRLLKVRRHTVDLLLPDEGSIDLESLRADCDLYVLKSGTETALSVAGALDAQGASMINSYPVTAACRDKVITTRMLQAGGVPVPQTWVTSRPEELAPLLEGGPLVLKPTRGSQGRGVVIAHRPEDLRSATYDVVLAQRYHRPDGPDRKLYCIGGEVFGVERIFPAKTYEEKVGRPLRVEPWLEELVLRCGRAMGIDLFGVDVVESGGRAWVVDLSSFPGFKGVPRAAELLADYVSAAARGTAHRNRVAG
jgi:ribosomal protein S6--L-glutamate ligase